MRQSHVGGDKLFVDYAGDTVPVVIDRLTGEVRQAQIFVAVMGASSFSYVVATWTQTLGDGSGPTPRTCSDRRRAASRRSRQRQGRRHQGLPVRAAGQPNVCRDGGALRHRRAADQAAPAARQGQGRSLRADRRALAHRSSARSPLLQPRRAERSDRRAAQAAQRGAPDPSTRRHPPATARRARPAGAQALADRALRLRRMARAPGRHRLSRQSSPRAVGSTRTRT